MTTADPELVRRFTEPTILRGGDPAGAAGSAWEPVTPAAAGFVPDLADRLDGALRAGQAPGLHALVVVRDGRLVLERYLAGEDFSWGMARGMVRFGPDTLHDLRSVTKSVVCSLYGMALAGGHVPDPAEPLLAQFPEYPDLAADPDRAELTVAHALTMTLGLEWREEPPYNSLANGEIAMMVAPDRWRYVLERPVVEPPGGQWRYCGGAAELIGRLIANGTGQPLPEYAHRALFAPLGIGGYEWLAGGDGVASAASGLRLAPRDLARIGQAVLAGGRWGEREVIPAGWLAAALSPRAETGWGAGYGYQWYVGGEGDRRWVAGFGNGDQRLLVYPELDLVVALTAGNYDTGDGSLATAVVDGVILAGLAR